MIISYIYLIFIFIIIYQIFIGFLFSLLWKWLFSRTLYLLMCVCVCVAGMATRQSEDSFWESAGFHSTMLLLGMALRSSGLVTNTANICTLDPSHKPYTHLLGSVYKDVIAWFLLPFPCALHLLSEFCAFLGCLPIWNAFSFLLMTQDTSFLPEACLSFLPVPSGGPFLPWASSCGGLAYLVSCSCCWPGPPPGNWLPRRQVWSFPGKMQWCPVKPKLQMDISILASAKYCIRGFTVNGVLIMFMYLCVGLCVWIQVPAEARGVRFPYGWDCRWL